MPIGIPSILSNTTQSILADEHYIGLWNEWQRGLALHIFYSVFFLFLLFLLAFFLTYQSSND